MSIQTNRLNETVLLSSQNICDIKLMRPNKKNKCVSGLKNLGRGGTFFLKKKFLEKNKILCILKGILPFKMHKIIFFPET